MNSSQINVEYNFLPNIDKFYNLTKKIPVFSFSEHPEINPKEDMKQNIWPGMRSNLLHKEEKFLEFFMLELAINKFKINVEKYYKVASYIHVRFDKDNETDFIHIDKGRDNLLLYLSPTNLDSGTSFYADDKKTLITDITFVQNTAIFFDGSIYHGSKNNFGTDIENGRMTMNMFFEKK